jgi:hypothetical protein
LFLLGALCVFSIAASQTYRETKLVAPDGAELDQFGASVAIAGEWAAVGAPGRDDRGENSGALYMFRKSNGRWRFSQKLLASDGAAGDALAGVSMDGEYLAASATRALYNGVRSGVVYLFKRMDTTWIQMRKVGPDPAVSDALFGISTSLKGVNLLVGAFLDREIGTQTGAAYVFTRTGEDWVQQARLLASDRRHLHNFGYTVSLFDSLALVGAPYDSNRNGTLAGAAYLFQRMGSSWHEKSKLIATDGLPYDLAGFVAIEAGHLIVCAPQSILVSRPGVAYAFTASSKHRQTFSARDGINRNAFGVTLSLRSDRLIVKASGDTSRGPGTGAAYLFLFKDSVWVQKHKFTASDGAAGANYGECAMDDSSIIIGALNARGTFSEQGAAYIYEPIVLSVHDVDHESREFMLHQNFPNPFNPSTEIRWKIPDVRLVRLSVFDILGREVAVLVNEVKDGGTHSVSFDASDLPSGVYYCRLVAGASRQTRKMVFIK